MEVLTQLNRHFNPWERVNKFYESPLFLSLCKKAFYACDIDGNGAINTAELWVALLLLFDKLNSKLPCHVTVPDKAEVKELMLQFDKGGDQQLSLEEFTELSKALLGNRKNLRNSLAFRVVSGVVFKVIGIPLIATGIKRSNVPGTDKLNLAVLSGLVATAPGLLSSITGKM